MKRILFMLVMLAVAGMTYAQGYNDYTKAEDDSLGKIYAKWFKENKKKGVYQEKIYYLDKDGKMTLLPLEKGKYKATMGLLPSEITGSKSYSEFKGVTSSVTIPSGEAQFIIEFPENIMNSLSDDILEYFVLRDVFCPVEMEVKKKTRRIILAKDGALLGLVGGHITQTYQDLQPVVERTKDGKIKVTCYHVQPGQYAICPYHAFVMPATFAVE